MTATFVKYILDDRFLKFFLNLIMMSMCLAVQCAYDDNVICQQNIIQHFPRK